MQINEKIFLVCYHVLQLYSLIILKFSVFNTIFELARKFYNILLLIRIRNFFLQSEWTQLTISIEEAL